jgi:hypothetical protein
MARRRGADFAVMSAAAGLMALGENAAMVVSALAGDIQAQLDLVDCEFTYGPPTGERPCVTRNGEVVRPSSPFPLGPAAELDLPVWLGTEVAGRYRLVLGPEEPDRDRLLVAVGLAEQAGAALAGARPDDPERRPFLRPVR